MVKGMRGRVMDKKCKCGGYICSYVNFNELAECCDCHKCYVLLKGKWKHTPKNQFRILYRERLIEQQNSNE